jgi:hypothetical protein
VAVRAGEEQLRPRGAPLLVVRPLHLVEDEHVARAGRHLDRAALDRRVLVDALLARDEADALVAELRRQPPVRLLREHAERPRVNAAPPLREERQRVMRLTGVRRPEVRDDGLRRRPPLGELDLDPVLGPPHRGALVRAGRAGVPRRARGAPRGSRASAPCHRATVAAGGDRPGSRTRP